MLGWARSMTSADNVQLYSWHVYQFCPEEVVKALTATYCRIKTLWNQLHCHIHWLQGLIFRANPLELGQVAAMEGGSVGQTAAKPVRQDKAAPTVPDAVWSYFCTVRPSGNLSHDAYYQVWICFFLSDFFRNISTFNPKVVEDRQENIGDWLNFYYDGDKLGKADYFK
jgi:hypothetical protein